MSKQGTNIKTARPRVIGNQDVHMAIREGIAKILSRKGGERKIWAGSVSELDRALRRVVSTRNINWPGSPSVMRQVINNVASSLRRSGVGVRFYRTPNHEHKRIVEFVRR